MIRSVPAISSNGEEQRSSSACVRDHLPRFSPVRNVSSRWGFRRNSNQLAVCDVTDEVKSFIACVSSYLEYSYIFIHEIKVIIIKKKKRMELFDFCSVAVDLLAAGETVLGDGRHERKSTHTWSSMAAYRNENRKIYN